MTSIHTYDPASAGAALPELPPMPIGALAVGPLEPAPAGRRPARSRPAITVSDHQTISMQFARHTASMRAITRWALRFGSVITSQPRQGTHRHRDLVPRPTSTTTASPSAPTPIIPASTGRILTHKCRARGTAIPRRRPDSPNPYLARSPARRNPHVSNHG